MSKLIQIPEANLEALLREAGRTESVEEYLGSDDVQANARATRLVKRAWAAYWSRFWLFLSAAVSWISFLLGPDVEGFICGVLLTGMTVVEFKVHAFFLAADVRGSIYGWWNQCLFSVLFLIYGGYHGTFTSLPPNTTNMIDWAARSYLNMSGTPVTPDVLGMFETELLLQIAIFYRLFYYTVAVVGGLGQFCLAWYYRTARK